MNRKLNRKLLAALALGVVGLIAACDIGGRLDTQSLGHLLKAGGDAYNANALSEKDEDSLGQSVGVAVSGVDAIKKIARVEKGLRDRPARDVVLQQVEIFRSESTPTS